MARSTGTRCVSAWQIPRRAVHSPSDGVVPAVVDPAFVTLVLVVIVVLAEVGTSVDVGSTARQLANALGVELDLGDAIRDSMVRLVVGLDVADSQDQIGMFPLDIEQVDDARVGASRGGGRRARLLQERLVLLARSRDAELVSVSELIGNGLLDVVMDALPDHVAHRFASSEVGRTSPSQTSTEDRTDGSSRCEFQSLLGSKRTIDPLATGAYILALPPFRRARRCVMRRTVGGGHGRVGGS